MATVTVRNGIDVQALRDTIDAIKAKPKPCSYVQETSLVRDVLANGVPVQSSIEVLP